MLTKKEVEHIAKLARLGLSDVEIEKFQGDLSSILDYISQLQDVDVEKIEPISNITGAQNVFRNDLAKKTNIESVRGIDTVKRILKEAPELQDGYIKVKAVF